MHKKSVIYGQSPRHPGDVALRGMYLERRVEYTPNRSDRSRILCRLSGYPIMRANEQGTKGSISFFSVWLLNRRVVADTADAVR